MESGQCHAAQAGASMDELTRGKRLKLTTADTSTASQGRPVRYIDAQSGSTWVDVQLAQLQRGHALPLAGMGDISRWKAYATAGQQAAVRRANLFDTDFCSRVRPSRHPSSCGSTTTATATRPTTPTPSTSGPQQLVDEPRRRRWHIRTAAQDTFTLPSNASSPPWVFSPCVSGRAPTPPPALLGRQRTEVLQRRPVPQHLRRRGLPVRPGR